MNVQAMVFGNMGDDCATGVAFTRDPSTGENTFYGEYLVNAQGGVQARELADWASVVRSGRPALAVVNKVDTLREADRERYLQDARDKLGVVEADFLAAAFDPLPQLSDSPLGVEEVRRWLTRGLVELGKERQELPWER